MKCDPETGCTHTCNSGRLCEDSLKATRRALWLPEETEPAEWWEQPATLAVLILIAVFLWGLLATVVN